MSANKNIGIITQARTTSTRLPKKVLLEVLGKTVLEHHINRLKSSGFPVFVATTVNHTDDAIVALCTQLDVPFYRGSEHDVLSRYYECAKQFKLDVIVRVTSDCPLIDGSLIAQGVQSFLESPRDAYVSNCIERTYPRGMDFEVFSLSSLEKAYQNATETFEREHVTPYVRNVQKNKNIDLIHLRRPVDASQYRLTLDEADDWKLLQTLIQTYQALEKNAEGLIHTLEANPLLAAINAHVEQKKV